MTSKQRAAAVVVLSVLGAVRPANAQTRILVANAVYESTDLVAPNLVLLIPAGDSGRPGGSRLAWIVGVRGSTLTIDAVKALSPRWAILFGAGITPFSANGSSRIYLDGTHEPDLGFTDRSYQAAAGVRFQPTPAWRTDIQFLGLKESVEGIDDTFWRRPYGGVEVAQSYRRVISEDPLQSRFDGFKATAAAERFVGSNAWWRARLMAGAGKGTGRLFVRGQASVFTGGGLDVVSRFLVGGSWDVGEGLPLYGFHYAQFRVDRGMVLNGGVDLRLKGAWEVGVRGGYLDSPDKLARGTAIRLGTIWNGVALHVGAGFPGHVSRESKGGAFVFAGITTSVIQ